MMAGPYDGPVGPPNGQATVAPQLPPQQRGPPVMQQPGQHNPQQQMHHQMNPPPYYRSAVGMPVGGPGGQPPHGAHGGHLPPQSPANAQQRQASFNGMHVSAGPQYAGHPPLHSPHGQPQGHPPGGMPPHMAQQMQQQQQHRGPMQHGGGGPGMGISMQHQQDAMMRASSSNNSHGRHQQQQQQYMHQNSTGSGGGGGGGSGGGGGGMNAGGNWQTDKDTPHRREMIQHIVKLLKKDKGGSPEAMTKLPQMAKQLEVSLYRNARSFEAYMDMNTLKQRLQQIAVEVSRKARSQSQGGTSSENNRDYSINDSQHRQQSQSVGGRRSEPPPGPPGPGGGGPNGPISPFGGGGGAGGPPVGGGGGRMVDMSEINPMATSGRSTGSVGAVYGGGGIPMPPDNNRNISVGAAGMPNRNDPEWKIRIRHKQQRLLLLHHSAKCMAEEGRCQVTPHCADMKRLWRHMEGCKDNNCRISHCFSSRAILSHYRKCKDPACPACGPVRETVRKSRGSSSSSASQGASSSRMPGSSSTGPMMNAMRGMAPGPAPPQQQPQQRGMMSPSHANDPMGDSSRNSYAGAQSMNSYSLSSSSRSNMPPPSSSVNAPGNSGMQFLSNSYSSHNRAIGNNPQGPGGGPGVSVQPLYGSDRQQAPPKPPASRMQQQPPSRPSVPPPPPSAAATQVSASRPSVGGGGSGRNDSEWQKIRHKQQRLLLLRHASRCQHEAGKCTVTPHCASMKKLWEHIAHCKNQQCTVQHCLSSRYVLSHYRRCKDARCPACGPVRETIRKSHEREKSRTAQDGSVGGGGLGGDGSLRSFDGMNRDESFNQPGDPPLSPPTEPDRKRPKTEHMSSAPTYPDKSMDRNSMATNTSSAPPPSIKQEIQPASLAPVPPLAQPSQSQPQVKSGEPGPPSSPTLAPVPESAPVSELHVGPASAPSDSIKEAKDTKVLDDCSLLESFTVQQLQTHLKSLERKTQLPPAKLKAKCVEVLKGLQTHQHGWVFNCPVDPVELGLPDYFLIIKKPMDLGTIQRKLESGTFHAIEDFAADVYLTFDNAMTYNEDGSVVYDMAKELKVKFEGDMKKLMKTLDDEDQERRQNERACMLCGCEKLLFEPPVYFCNGMNCQSQRIRRNSHFYIGGNNQYFWCSSCYNELDDKIPIELVDMTIKKSDLKKKKNDEVHEESWVQCDTCEKWVHQICGLFNTRQNKEHHSEYCCPKCLLDKRQATSIQPTPPKPPCASDLPRTALSEWLENSITKKIARRKRELAVEKAAHESISLEEATRIVESGGAVIVRQVTSMDRKLEVRDLMKKRYAHKNYPEEFPFRCKCLVVFQHLDGVDVVLFALYVYEHDEKSPPPNQRVVYISYLDSVHFMRPRNLRTFVYHEILIAYLDYARRRGYSTAHIWACPPLKGDDYIFYAKPEDQKTPRDSRLRLWYIDMLVEAQKRSIVGKVTNMYDLYFADDKIDATAVPYLEGDYFPGEAENIIRMLEDGGGKKGGGGAKKKKSKTSNKNKGSTGTRSGGVDEEALIASGMYDGVKNFKDLDRDQVMVKLGETILPMKDSFIVAFLNWSGAREEDLVVPEDIEKARIEYAASKDDGELAGSKRDAIGNVRDVSSAEGIKVVDDDTEDLDCEFLNNRQAFLNLCRGNHYQFDELRRAKHTSMMVLWHLHNRDAPKFVQQCVSCNREILSGNRYHCNTCPDYDLCQECFKDPNVNRGACTHTLQPIAVEPDANKERSGLSEAERLQRQRNLMLHIQLIEHASRCQSKTCTSTNCAKMKQYLHHARVCRVKVQGGCRICKRIWTLLRIHAQKCKDPKCPIPQCTAIREKMRQLQKQQQAMDDRRRLEMNRHMRHGGAT